MEIIWTSAIWAGLVATLIMTILMYLAKAMGMPMDMPWMLGLMFTGPENRGTAYTLFPDAKTTRQPEFVYP